MQMIYVSSAYNVIIYHRERSWDLPANTVESSKDKAE